MAGTYGEILLAWPEQQTAVEIFDMAPKQNAGWTVDSESSTTVIGVFQNTRGGQVKDSNGNLVKSDGRELWTATGGLEGKFALWGGNVYRLKDKGDWSREGGFWRYGLEKVVGNNGTESDDASWNTGANSFS